jgi:hypothetical protein
VIQSAGLAALTAGHWLDMAGLAEARRSVFGGQVSLPQHLIEHSSDEAVTTTVGLVRKAVNCVNKIGGQAKHNAL